MWVARNYALNGQDRKEGQENCLSQLHNNVSILFKRAKRLEFLQDEDTL